MAVSKLLVLICLAVCAGQGRALQCYVCNSRIDASCDDILVPEKYVVTCDPLNAKAIEYSNNRTTSSGGATAVPLAPAGTVFTYCRKTKFMIPIQKNGEVTTGPTTRIERSCGYIGKEANACKWQTSFGGNQVFTCQCDGDKCNSAGLWTASALILAALQASLFLRNYVLHL